ncbi:MAG: M15 family metallopeptidase, partial [Methyloligellaceae bacterium]
MGVRQIRWWIGFAGGLLLTGSGAAATEARPPGDRATRILSALVIAYPDLLAGHDGKSVIWRDGTRMTFDDGVRGKRFDDLLNRPDLEDQFYAPYPRGRRGLRPGVNIDPGRVRFEPFFKKMYGDCKRGKLGGRLVDVVWLPKHWGKRVKVTSVNGVAKRLQAVSNELDALPGKFLKYLKPSAGTYNCRTIAGTKRLSVHAFGAAIDINVKYAD